MGAETATATYTDVFILLSVPPSKKGDIKHASI